MSVGFKFLSTKIFDLNFVDREPRNHPRLSIAVGSADTKFHGIGFGFPPVQPELELDEVHSPVAFRRSRSILTSLRRRSFLGLNAYQMPLAYQPASYPNLPAYRTEIDTGVVHQASAIP